MKFMRSRRFLIAGAVVGIGALGVGAAGAVTGGDSTPGPNPAAGDHPNSHATETIPSVVDTPTTHGPSNPVENAAAPGVGEAPTADALANALAHNEGTFGNTVLNDLLNTAPGPDRGATISSDAQSHTPPRPSLPDAAANGQSHRP